MSRELPRALGMAGIGGQILGQVLCAAAGVDGLRAKCRGAAAPLLPTLPPPQIACRRRRRRHVDVAARAAQPLEVEVPLNERRMLPSGAHGARLEHKLQPQR